MDKITFSFGKNWAEYADTVDAQAIETAKRTLKEWLGQERIAQSKIIDIGSGFGFSSRSLIELGCQDLVAFDYDQASVATTRKLLNNCTAEKLDIFHGSILDANLVENISLLSILCIRGACFTIQARCGRQLKMLRGCVRRMDTCSSRCTRPVISTRTI